MCLYMNCVCMRVRARVRAGLCVGARVWVCGGAHVRACAREAAYVSVRVSPRLGALELCYYMCGRSVFVRVWVSVSVRVGARERTCVRTYMRTYMRTCMWAHVRRAYACVFASVRVCMCLRERLHVRARGSRDRVCVSAR